MPIAPRHSPSTAPPGAALSAAESRSARSYRATSTRIVRSSMVPHRPSPWSAGSLADACLASPASPRARAIPTASAATSFAARVTAPPSRARSTRTAPRSASMTSRARARTAPAPAPSRDARATRTAMAGSASTRRARPSKASARQARSEAGDRERLPRSSSRFLVSLDPCLPTPLA
jgi:hypothetical protein